jgi:NAD(P)-dependent dehydrogenase (short-subunit alcohol dehydrogenase family)
MAKLTPRGNYPNAAPKDRDYGSIVVVSSAASTDGSTVWGGGPAYTMAAHAALGVVRAGVPVLKGTAVRINCISPGVIDTTASGSTDAPAAPASIVATGLNRAGTPAEVGRVAGFLASSFSSYITGQNLIVDGGATAMGPGSA